MVLSVIGNSISMCDKAKQVTYVKHTQCVAWIPSQKEGQFSTCEGRDQCRVCIVCTPKYEVWRLCPWQSFSYLGILLEIENWSPFGNEDSSREVEGNGPVKPGNPFAMLQTGCQFRWSAFMPPQDEGNKAMVQAPRIGAFLLPFFPKRRMKKPL